MTFTVVRAVRAVDSAAGQTSDRLPKVAGARLRAPARMDLPFAAEAFHLDLSDSVDTVPAALE